MAVVEELRERLFALPVVAELITHSHWLALLPSRVQRWYTPSSAASCSLLCGGVHWADAGERCVCCVVEHLMVIELHALRLDT